MDLDYYRDSPVDAVDDVVVPRPSPGKCVMTARIRPRRTSGTTPAARPVQRATPTAATSPIQLTAAFDAALGFEPTDAHAVADRGVSGGGAALPFLSEIQTAFGRHDVSHVRAHTGAGAHEAASALGARAYATGSDVAFGAAPDLHTAAHEAAHVVQQAAGVHLADGLGRAGDRYERHADAVADAVVRGESAEALLDQFGPGPATASVQRSVQLSPEDELPEGERPRHGDRRRIIAFILGSDEYHQAAARYWRSRADYVVTNCRTLEEVLETLRGADAQRGEQPWGEINLVSHGNEEGGMQMPMHGDAPAGTSPAELDREISLPEGSERRIHSLPDEVVDGETNVNIHGCAVGRSPEMLETMSRAIGGEDAERPSVYAPRDLQHYEAHGRSSSESLLEFWTVGYPEGESGWGAERVQAEFARRYSGESGTPNWAEVVPVAMRDPHTDTFTITNQIQGYRRVPNEGDLAQHRRFLRHTHPTTLGRARELEIVSEDRNPGPDRDYYTFTYRVDGGDGTTSVEIDTPHVPQTAEERLEYARFYANERADDYAWEVEISGADGALGAEATVTLQIVGRRTVIRVERAVEGRPSREDADHYGAYHPPGHGEGDEDADAPAESGGEEAPAT